MLLTVVLACVIMPATVFADGEYFLVDGISYQVVDEAAKTVEVVYPNKAPGSSGAPSYVGNIVIPATVENAGVTYSVVGIGFEAFYHADIESITLPEGLKYIDGRAFIQSNLTSIHIPSTVERIGVENNPDYMSTHISPVFNAANDPIRLESITFEEGSQLTILGAGVFEYTAISSIDLPDTLKTIESRAFSQCTKLTSIVLPESVTDIYRAAFSGCSSLKELYISADVDLHTERGQNGSRFFGGLSGWLDYNFGTVTFEEGSRYAVEDGLFYDGTDLLGPIDKEIQSAVIREGTKLIAPYAFTKCGSLSSVTIPDSLTTIGEMAFNECSSLETIDLKNVTTLDRHAFFYAGLTSIVIPEGVTTIPLAAFANTDNLAFIKIPSTVTEIGLGAFQKLSFPSGTTVSVIMEGTVPPNVNANAFRNIPTESMNLIVPAGSEAAYAANEPFKTFMTNPDGTIKDGISFGVEFPTGTRFCPGSSFEVKCIKPKGASVEIRLDCAAGIEVKKEWNEEASSYTVTLISGEGSVKATVEINMEEVGNILRQSSDFVAGHSYGEWVQIQTPDCTHPGKEERICTLCGNKEIREGTAPVHGETVLQNAKTATCLAEGYTGDQVCTVCGEVVQRGAVIEKLPHHFENGKCTVCGAADPNATVPPKTGDSSNVPLWAALLLVSGAGAWTAAFHQKRGKAK